MQSSRIIFLVGNRSLSRFFFFLSHWLVPRIEDLPRINLVLNFVSNFDIPPRSGKNYFVIVIMKECTLTA